MTRRAAILHATLAAELGLQWPPGRREALDLGKHERGLARKASWRQTAEVIDFPMTAADQNISEKRL
jgi:hypothetical protein